MAFWITEEAGQNFSPYCFLHGGLHANTKWKRKYKNTRSIWISLFIILLISIFNSHKIQTNNTYCIYLLFRVQSIIYSSSSFTLYHRHRISTHYMSTFFFAWGTTLVLLVYNRSSIELFCGISSTSLPSSFAGHSYHLSLPCVDIRVISKRVVGSSLSKIAAN